MGRSGPENNLWFSINSPGRVVPYYLQAGQAAKVLARAISSTKLHTVAESNNRDHLTRSLCYCLYSGFTFSHYDLPFPTRYCIPYVRSGLYQLVIRFKGFRVSADDLDSHCIRFCPSAWTPRFQRESSCVSLAHGPRWLFLLSRHRKAFLLLLIRSLL